MSMAISIRPVVPDDAAAVASILNRVIETGAYSAFDSPFSVENERDYILGLSQRSVFLVAVRDTDQRVVGFQSMDPFATWTSAFAHVGVMGTYIDLDCRRQGIAKRLFPATFEDAIQKGYRKIFTYIRTDNPAALATYQHHGFTIVGVAKAHMRVKDRYIDEYVVERMLTTDETERAAASPLST
jgi:L-amino acid N-acyltransferase YncA